LIEVAGNNPVQMGSSDLIVGALPIRAKDWARLHPDGGHNCRRPNSQDAGDSHR
jgi:hypothetical protein